MEWSDPEGVLPEAQRRLHLLGPLATALYDYQRLRERAGETYVPLKILWTWWHTYQQDGIDGLTPSDWTPWTTLSTKAQRVITSRLASLGDLVHARAIPDECDLDEYIPVLAKRNQWSLRTAERWVRRYQVGGWWSLAPKHDPTKSSTAQKPEARPSLGALDEEALEETFRRRELLGPLATDRKSVV